MVARKILITGATGSIGSTILELLNKNWNQIYISGTNRSKLEELIQLHSNKDSNLYWGAYDLSKHVNVKHLISDVRKKIGEIEILINCAGIFTQFSIKETDDNELIKCLNLNFIASYLLSREFVKEMTQKKWGRIINIGSSSAYYGFKNTTAYCASKHALLGFSKALHDEVKEFNIKVMCISPSSTKGRMGMQTIGQDYDTFLDPKDVADFIVSAMCNDSNLVIEDILLKRMNIS